MFQGDEQALGRVAQQSLVGFFLSPKLLCFFFFALIATLKGEGARNTPHGALAVLLGDRVCVLSDLFCLCFKTFGQLL